MIFHVEYLWRYIEYVTRYFAKFLLNLYFGAMHKLRWQATGRGIRTIVNTYHLFKNKFINWTENFCSLFSLENIFFFRNIHPGFLVKYFCHRKPNRSSQNVNTYQKGGAREGVRNIQNHENVIYKQQPLIRCWRQKIALNTKFNTKWVNCP